MRRRDDIEEARVRVHLEESAKDAIQDNRAPARRDAGRTADEQERGRTADKRGNLKPQAKARMPDDEAIRDERAKHDRRESRHVVVEHRAAPRRADRKTELARDELRRPAEIGVVREDDGDEADRREQRGRIAEVGPQGRRERRCGGTLGRDRSPRRPRCLRIGIRGRSFNAKQKTTPSRKPSPPKTKKTGRQPPSRCSAHATSAPENISPT